LDERRQRALTRYYVAAGVGGLALGVHTTQFEIRDPSVGLLRPVLELAAVTLDDLVGPEFVRVAGITGDTTQAVAEAALAAELGYHLGLLNLGELHRASLDELLAQVDAVAQVMPVFGFYLQPAVGGRELSYSFWRRLVEVPNVEAIKIAPFNRYHTSDVVRAVVDANCADQVALYTGNDDHILLDLLTTFRFSETATPVRMVGGILGHWAFWTRRAVEQHAECRRLVESQECLPEAILTLAAQITDVNAAVFDAANGYAGCIPGIHHILQRQGLLDGTWCLSRSQKLSSGQAEAIDRVYEAYPHLNDDEFVAEHIDAWLG
jgi:dihydrodipicolinate synthase/N-acetylneuraminate lyase